MATLRVTQHCVNLVGEWAVVGPALVNPQSADYVILTPNHEPFIFLDRDMRISDVFYLCIKDINILDLILERLTLPIITKFFIYTPAPLKIIITLEQKPTITITFDIN